MKMWLGICFLCLACMQVPAGTKETGGQRADTVYAVAQRYKWLQDSVRLQREQWKAERQKGRPAGEIRRKAAAQLYNWLNGQVYDLWYGTPWDFYGTTEVPQQGTIACGYFVSTVLRDLGFKLDRVAMAETYSEKFIRTLINGKYVKRYSKFNLEEFLSDMQRGPDQVCLAGLDNHIGIILVKNHEVSFLHSSVLSPGCVVKENASESMALAINHYMVLGSITADTTLMNNWSCMH